MNYNQFVFSPFSFLAQPRNLLSQVGPSLMKRVVTILPNLIETRWNGMKWRVRRPRFDLDIIRLEIS